MYRTHNRYVESAAAQRPHYLVLIGKNMLGQIARWGHNVLLTTMALLTVAVVIYLIK
jgi:hypothetical protein